VSWADAAARARGLVSRIPADAELDRLAITVDTQALEERIRAETCAVFATLARWVALDTLELDEDRRSLRAIARGLAAGASAHRKLAATIATSSLDERTLAAIVDAPTLAIVAEQLVELDHPLAPALRPFVAPARGLLDLFAIELALARRFAELASGRGDRALRLHVAQVIDAENAAAALQLASRGGELEVETAFIPGGARLDRSTFAAACRDPERLVAPFAHTPLAAAVLATPPGALDEAALAWHLDTQARLRVLDPHGAAAVLYLVLRRRRASHRLRRTGWRHLLGGSR
jgi:ATP synthase C subunit